MNKKPRILILEDNPADCELEIRELRLAQLDFESEWVETREAFLEALKDFQPDVIISDYGLPQFNGLEALRLLREINFDTPFILCTGSLTEEVAVRCMKEGATDYILKSSLKRLPSAVLNALEKNESHRARKEVIAALQESEARYRLLGEGIMHQVWTAQPDGKLDYVNQRTLRYFGMTGKQLIGEGWQAVIHPDDLPTVVEHWTKSLTTGADYAVEFRLKRADGDYRWHSGLATAGRDPDGNIIKWFGTNTDVEDKKSAEKIQRESEYKLRTLLASMSEGLVQVNNDEVIEFVNDRFCEMSGYARGEMLGKITYEILFDEENGKFVREANRLRSKGISSQYELPLKKKTGETWWSIVGGTPITNAEGEVVGTMGVFTDITTRKRAEEQLLHDAFHDSLTGLANRALFMDHLRMTIERGKSRHSNSYAILFLDFDRFKVINDSLGHSEGDNLLKFIAQRLKVATRTGDLVARLGGDEFVVLLSELAEDGDAVKVAERIQDSLKNSFDLNGHEIFISASIGIALSASGHKRAEDMVRDADIAMYRAKAKGKARYEIFDQAMHQHASKQLRLETEMRRALDREEFLLHYQPIINLETGRLIGFEALVRWRHPERGMVPPFEFIGAAEDNGLILPLGAWTLEESCRQLREWQDANPAAENLSVSVNFSSKQFSQPDLAEQIAAVLKKTGLDPRCLKLEITESHIMDNSEMAVATMNRLRSLGIELSLDDFGTGYSSLSYLHRLPASFLKVDRSFVSLMTDNSENSEIVHTIIKLAQNLKMHVVAEGIETADQLANLRQLNCEYGQGYFFSEPLEAEKAEIFINENAGNLSDSQILERIKLGQNIEHYETARLRKNGEAISVSLPISPIKDSGGAITGASAIARDITEQK
ncbi:MAG: diguanylate cyclase/phosphodiesterase (GGDEF & EAL domains) with PAS/PAC sensor(s) [uncultured Pyrinomonadaceae bacterium]|uniref:Diguanylate cyclase/phosphodiesterase (GGDEF & EAL domains) with PAS/PAC sensor(S) n=1 Tax=uncultured Pyrinomonadaceae bacterium TaxID=2283094 RepID=A0A6J4PSN8_9BACT|nr:MAG: diguanylate cyclase/phosphodiesterase (GGDEF & EAL domains) with PAS/PAC sensor(s) [uncultured Pyrinomonadaceae bacterium]